MKSSHIYLYSTLYNTDCFKAAYINKQENKSITVTELIN